MSSDTLPLLQPARHFGRVSVSVYGRVLMSISEGPFDAELMTATRRAIALAGKRLPADRRFADLVEIRGSLQIDTDALEQLRQVIAGFSRHGIVPVASVFLVQAGIPGIERLPALMDIWRASRPVQRAETRAAAWAMVNANLAAAGLPTQPPPDTHD